MPCALTLLNQFYAPDISPTAQLAASLAEHRAALGDEVTVITGRAGYLEGLGPDDALDAGPAGARATGVDARPRARRRWPAGCSGYVDLPRRRRGAGRCCSPRQDVIVAMTTPPFVVVVALLHKLLHRRTRVVLWSMDCYPDAAERFGELRPGGAVSRVLRARQPVGVPPPRPRRRARRRHGRAPHLAVRRRARTARRATVIPNWERADAVPADADRAAVGRATTSCRRRRPHGRALPRQHRASATGSTPCVDAAAASATRPCSCSSAAAPAATTLGAAVRRARARQRRARTATCPRTTRPA